MAWQGFVAVLTSLVVVTNSYTHEEMVEITSKARKLPNNICGIPSNFGYQMFNGTHATEGSYPWMVAIGYADNSGNPYWSCGGSLITDQYVMTAAHCVNSKDNISPERLLVRLSDLNLDDSNDDTNSTENKEVEKIIVHPQYYENKLNDIALIKLKSRVEFDRLKKPICLPTLPEFYDSQFISESAMVIGWKKLERERKTILTEISLEIKENDSCRSNSTGDSQNVISDDKFICALSPSKDSCYGDSGGPLMVLQMDKGEPKLFSLGLVSRSYGCPGDEFPGIYIKISYFMPWIVDNLEF